MMQSEKKINGDLVSVNIRGFRYELDKDVLERNPSSKLSSMYKEMDVPDKTLYINRDPFMAKEVINFYYTGTLSFPNVCTKKIEQELDFWELSVEDMCPESQMKYRADKQAHLDQEKTVKKWFGFLGQPGVGVQPMNRVLWDFLEGPTPSILAKIYSAFIFIVVMVSIVAVSLSTLPNFKQYSVLDTYIYDSTNIIEMIGNKFMSESYFIIDCTMLLILSIDIVLRLIAFGSIKAYMSHAINVIGILTIVPTMIGYVVLTILVLCDVYDIRKDGNKYFIYIFAAFRVLYLLKIAKNWKPLKIVTLTLRDSAVDLLIMSFMMLAGSLLFANIMYLVEMASVHSHFQSIPDALWWAVVTMTTVGYGDYRPIGWLGKIKAVFCALSGLAIILTYVPVVAAHFWKYYKIASRTNPTRKKEIMDTAIL